MSAATTRQSAGGSIRQSHLWLISAMRGATAYVGRFGNKSCTGPPPRNAHLPTNNVLSPNEKWGPALLPAPICAERRIRRCSSALVTRRSPAPRSWLTSSGVASGRRSQSEDGFHFLPRPFLDQSLSASPASRETPRYAEERLALPAPLPAGPIRSRSFSSSPAGGDRTFRPVLILPVVADDPGRLELSSRSPSPYVPPTESRKVDSAPRGLWITGISRITARSEHSYPPTGDRDASGSVSNLRSSSFAYRPPKRLFAAPRPV